MLSENAPPAAIITGLWLSKPVGRDGMRKFNVANYYRLGVLISAHRGTFMTFANPMEVKVRALHELKTLFQAFLDGSVDTDWKATKQAAKQVLALLEPRVGNNPAELYVAPFEAGYESRINQAISTFEITFVNESSDANIFSVSQKGTHSTLDLMERAYDNLSPDVQTRLSEETKTDIAQAGRCLALDCHTASGYHILRAVERVIVKYVNKLTKTITLKKKPRDWGAYITALKNNGGDVKVIGNLQHIKDHYRNPVIHPQDTLSADDAFSLFNTCISAIIQLDAAIEALP